jgi:ribosomal protein S18 acetylase RimI-like enzyme
MNIALKLIQEKDFHSFAETTCRNAAKDLLETYRLSEVEALQEASRFFHSLLPQGFKTPNHFIYSIDETGKKIGHLWYGLLLEGQLVRAYLYDIFIDQHNRRKGFASQALRLLENELKGKGANRISLHLFANNRGARKLYEKLGYHETTLMMGKELKKIEVA